MAQDIDLYSVLKQFAYRAGSNELEYAAFMLYVQRWAKHNLEKNPQLKSLAESPESTVNPKLVQMQRERKCVLVTEESRIKLIVLTEYYTNLITLELKKIEETPDTPFPDEETLKIQLPPDWIQSVSVENDLGALLLREGDFQHPFYRITFTESLKPIIVLPAFLREKMLEYAVLKIRNWLRKGSNREYVNRKMISAFLNKELMLKDSFNLVMTRPYDAIQEIVRSTSDFTFPFWAYLLSNVRQDLQKKTDKTHEDLSLFQSVILTEFFNNHYRSKAQRVLDVETAFKNLDQCLRKPPFFFTIDDICCFTDTKGSPLLGKFTKEELEKYLHEKTRSVDQYSMPELIFFVAGGIKKYFLAKDKVLQLCVKMFAEARLSIRNQMLQNWFKLMGDFLTYPAIEDDDVYRAELWSRLEKTLPVLYALLKENIFTLVWLEVKKQGAFPEIDRYFRKNELVPIDEIFQLMRKDLLTDVKILLPFWYTIPFFSSIVGFFLRRKKKKKKVEPEEAEEAEKKPENVDRRAELAMAATAVEKAMVPSGMSLDDYLVDLEGNWNKMINPKAKRDLTEDVNSLIRDYIRGIIRTLRAAAFTPERVRALSATLADSPSLLKIKNHKALEEYITMYIIRLVKTTR